MKVSQMSCEDSSNIKEGNIFYSFLQNVSLLKEWQQKGAKTTTEKW